MSSKLEPAIWSRDTGQRISWFDSCQLNIVWMSNIKDICCNPRLHVLVLARWPPCCATSFVVVVVVVVVGRTRPWSMPLAILTIRKELHGFLFLCIRVVPFSIIMGLRLAALRAAGAPLKSLDMTSRILVRIDCTKIAGQILDSSERNCRICLSRSSRFWHIALIVILIILREKEFWANWIWRRYWWEWEREDAWKLGRKPFGITGPLGESTSIFESEASRKYLCPRC